MENFEKIKELAKKAGISDGKLNNEFLFYNISKIKFKEIKIK